MKGARPGMAPVTCVTQRNSCDQSIQQATAFAASACAANIWVVVPFDFHSRIFGARIAAFSAKVQSPYRGCSDYHFGGNQPRYYP